MIDVLYIHPSATRSTPSFLFMPVGIIALLADLNKAGLEVLAVNEALEMALDPSFQIEKYLRSHRSRCYALDIHWHEHLYGALFIAKLIRRLFPDACIVVGGMTATYFANELSTMYPFINFVIAGYGEGAFESVVWESRSKSWRSNNSVVIHSTNSFNLDSLDFSAQKFIVHLPEYFQCSVHAWHPDCSNRAWWLCVGRGCSHNCAFCGGSRSAQRMLFGNDRVVCRSPERVADDIASLSLSDVRSVNFTMDISEYGKPYWSRLFALISEKKIQMGAYLEANGLLSTEFLRMFADTFDMKISAIALTPLSVNDKIRKKNGKDFTTDELLSCLTDLHRYRIPFAIYFADGLPRDKSQNIHETVMLQSLIKKEFEPLFVFRTTLTLDPASPMFCHSELYGIQTSLVSLRDYVRRCRMRSEGKRYDKYGYRAVAVI